MKSNEQETKKRKRRKDEPGSIGSRLKDLRMQKEGSPTQDDVAKAINVTRQAVNNWENNDRDLSIQYVMMFADYYETTCDYILRGNKPENVDINRRLGLSDKTIAYIAHLKDLYKHHGNYFINTLFEHGLSILQKWQDVFYNYVDAEIKCSESKPEFWDFLPGLYDLRTHRDVTGKEHEGYFDLCLDPEGYFDFEFQRAADELKKIMKEFIKNMTQKDRENIQKALAAKQAEFDEIIYAYVSENESIVIEGSKLPERVREGKGDNK